MNRKEEDVPLPKMDDSPKLDPRMQLLLLQVLNRTNVKDSFDVLSPIWEGITRFSNFAQTLGSNIVDLLKGGSIIDSFAQSFGIKLPKPILDWLKRAQEAFKGKEATLKDLYDFVLDNPIPQEEKEIKFDTSVSDTEEQDTDKYVVLDADDEDGSYDDEDDEDAEDQFDLNDLLNEN